jgi:hypothetical protein
MGGGVKSAGGRCQDVPELPEMGTVVSSYRMPIDALPTRNRGSVSRRPLHSVVGDLEKELRQEGL